MTNTQPLKPTDEEIEAVVQACRARGLYEFDVFRAVVAKFGAPQPVALEPLTRERVKAICAESGYETATLQERADFINGIRHAERHHGIKGGQHGTE